MYCIMLCAVCIGADMYQIAMLKAVTVVVLDTNTEMLLHPTLCHFPT